MDSLIRKYDRPGPRYTSYPPVPYWNGVPQEQVWLEHIQNNYNESEGIDLYIHIPYCEKLCYYCGCNRSITKDFDKGQEYVELLKKEWLLYAKKLNKKLKVNSLHFGGGTPTFLKPEYLKDLLAFIQPSFTENFIGSIEVDPRTCVPEHLDILKEFGFERISMGIQDFDLTVQKAINRVQPKELVQKLVAEVRKRNFKSLNFDLIYGLPYQNVETIKNSINTVIDLSPEMIAFYSYAHLPAKLKNQKLLPEEALPTGPAKRELYNQGKALLEKLGYREIGLDHFAKDDSYLAKVHKEHKLLRNFMGYTDKKSSVMIGLGLTSISNTPNSFAQNHKDLKDYVQSLESEIIPIKNGHIQSDTDLIIEDIVQKIMCNGYVQVTSANQVPHWEEIKLELLDMEKDGLLDFDKEKNIIATTKVGQVFLRNVAMLFDNNLRAKINNTRFSQTV
jgi:oxygen-independent coproporphyrinogen III oxidase